MAKLLASITVNQHPATPLSTRDHHSSTYLCRNNLHPPATAPPAMPPQPPATTTRSGRHVHFPTRLNLWATISAGGWCGNLPQSYRQADSLLRSQSYRSKLLASITVNQYPRLRSQRESVTSVHQFRYDQQSVQIGSIIGSSTLGRGSSWQQPSLVWAATLRTVDCRPCLCRHHPLATRRTQQRYTS
jgi:hypothetical protein